MIFKKQAEIFLLVTFIFFCLLFPHNIFAAWTRYDQNPVFPVFGDGWEKYHVQCSSLIREQDVYKMWYGANGGIGWRIGYAFSPDGKQNWQRGEGPVIDLLEDIAWGEETTDPYVMWDDNQYKMWYSSLQGMFPSSGPDRYRTKYATSADGINWEENDWVLRGTPGEWDSGGIARGLTVLKMGDEYKMWYAGGNEKQMGTLEEKWRIGYATSPDGINWTKYAGNPVIEPIEWWERNMVSYPNVIYEDGVYHMFYAATSLNLPVSIVYAISTDGIHWEKPASKNPVFGTGPASSFDSRYVASPFVIKEGDIFRIWYDGLASDHWQIGYIEGNFDDVATPTPTPTPTPPLQPIVLLPGLGASWNYQAMILGEDQPQENWRMTPGVRDYDGLIETLENAGYQKNDDLFIFNYDWRQPVNQIADQLEEFLQKWVYPKAEDKIDLIGHSLGGLAARTYLQQYPDHQVDQLITLGSPHRGSVKVYPIWEGGVLTSSFPFWQRLAISLLLQLNRQHYFTAVQAVRAFAPGLKDLLPIFPYLKECGECIPVSWMDQQNIWLKKLNEAADERLFLSLHTFAGRIPDSTLRWIHVTSPSWIERLAGLWTDGKPTGKEELDDGDETVLSQSAEFGNQVTLIEGANHSEILTSAASQAKIMEVLGLAPTSVSTVSENINDSPTLIFNLASPATVAVLDPNGQPAGFRDSQTVFVPEAVAGRYQIKINGAGEGIWHLDVGEIADVGERWHSLAGFAQPGEQTDYWFEFSPDLPFSDPWPGQEQKICQQSIPARIAILKQALQIENLAVSSRMEGLFYLDSISRLTRYRQYEQAILYSYRLHQWLASLVKLKKISQSRLPDLQSKVMAVADGLQSSCALLANQNYSQRSLDREIMMAARFFGEMEGNFHSLPPMNDNVGQAALYLLAQEKLALAKSTSGCQAHLHALAAKELSLEGIKWW